MKKTDLKIHLHQTINECSFSIDNSFDFMNTQQKNYNYDNMTIYKMNTNSNAIYQNNLNMNLIFCPIPQDKNIFYQQIYDNIQSITQCDQLYDSTNAHLYQNSKTPNNISSNISPKRNLFTTEEDNLLLQLVKSFGTKNWQKISSEMKKHNIYRNGRQCRDRYYHYLNPNIDFKSKWTHEKDNLLLNTVQKQGTRWKIMERIFPGQTEVSLRNRYNLLKRKERKNQKQIEKNLLFKIDKTIQESSTDNALSEQINKNTSFDFDFDSLNNSSYLLIFSVLTPLFFSVVMYYSYFVIYSLSIIL